MSMSVSPAWDAFVAVSQRWSNRVSEAWHRSRNATEIASKSDEVASTDVARTEIRGIAVDFATARVCPPGQPSIELRRQSVAVLQVLVEKRGNIVSKTELFEQVWGDVVVTEDSLVQCIGDIRKALGPSRDALRTIPRQGYLLEREPLFTPSTEESSGMDPRRFWWIGVAVLATVILLGLVLLARVGNTRPRGFEGPVVAIHAFENLGDNRRWDRLARAFTVDVIDDLAQNSWLFVIGEDTVLSMNHPSKSRTGDLPEIDYQLNGAIQAEGSQLHITVTLTDARSGRKLWSRQWEGVADQLLVLQRTATEALTAELAASWSGPIAAADRAAALGRGTDTLSAYELAQLAIDRSQGFTPQDFDAAIALLQQAVAIDPGFGDAWAYLAYCYFNRIAPDTETGKARELIAARDHAALTALKVSPNLPNPLIQAGEVIAQHDRVGAERLFRRAIAVAGNNADVLAYAASKAPMTPDLASDALDWMNLAMRLNPRHPDTYWWNYGNVLFTLGRYEEAADAYAKGPDFVDVHVLTAVALALSGQTAKARASFEQVMRDSPAFAESWMLQTMNWDPAIEASLSRGLALARQGQSS